MVVSIPTGYVKELIIFLPVGITQVRIFFWPM